MPWNPPKSRLHHFNCNNICMKFKRKKVFFCSLWEGSFSHVKWTCSLIILKLTWSIYSKQFSTHTRNLFVSFSVGRTEQLQLHQLFVLDQLLFPNLEPVLDAVLVLHVVGHRLRPLHVHCEQPVLEKRLRSNLVSISSLGGRLSISRSTEEWLRVRQ